MEVNKGLLEKAKAAKSAEELAEMAKAEGVELTAEEAAKAFAKLNEKGELADEELDNVAGGCGNPSPMGEVKSADCKNNSGQKRIAENQGVKKRLHSVWKQLQPLFQKGKAQKTDLAEKERDLTCHGGTEIFACSLG